MRISGIKQVRQKAVSIKFHRDERFLSVSVELVHGMTALLWLEIFNLRMPMFSVFNFFSIILFP